MRQRNHQQSEQPISLLQQLRALVPAQGLNSRDALLVVEAQARRFLKHFGLAEPPVATSLISHLTRLQIVVSDDMPETCSGLTAWTGKEWLISLNGHEPELRRRFSLFHEAAHIVHHTTGEALYPTQRGRAGLLRELLADHFAGSVLVPKPWLKSLYCSGHIDIAELSDLFLVSRRAIEVRLHVYGLRELPPLSERRARPFATNWTPTYLRVFPAPVGVAA